MNILHYMIFCYLITDFPSAKSLLCRNESTGVDGICTHNTSCFTNEIIGFCSGHPFSGVCCIIKRLGNTTSEDAGFLLKDNGQIIKEPTSSFASEKRQLNPWGFEMTTGNYGKSSFLMNISSVQRKPVVFNSSLGFKPTILDFSQRSNNHSPSYEQVSPPQSPLQSQRIHIDQHSLPVQRQSIPSQTLYGRKFLVPNFSSHQNGSLFAQSSLEERRSIALDPSNDQKEPVTEHSEQDQRRPEIVNSSHHQRKLDFEQVSRYQRKQSFLDSSNIQRLPVAKNLYHDQKITISQIPYHDQRLLAPHPLHGLRSLVYRDPSFSGRQLVVKDSPLHQISPLAEDLSHNQRKPAILEVLHDPRKPSLQAPDHQLRKIGVKTQVDNVLTPAMQSQGHDLRKPVMHAQDHDLRKPVMHAQDHDLTKPVMYVQDHDLRKPVMQVHDHNLRIPVALDESHNLRRLILPEESHDLRWPTLEEDSHDMRLPIGNFYGYQNLSLESSSVDSGIRGTPSSTSTTSEMEMSDIRPPFEFRDINIFPDYDFFTDAFNGENILHAYPDISKVCGRPKSEVTARLVGGIRSHHLQWPWMVSLRIRLRRRNQFWHKCGATLLNRFWVITAAHCVQGKLLSHMKLRLGEYRLRNAAMSSSYVERNVDRMVIHEYFDPETYENDLALLRFDEPVQFEDRVIPICLPMHWDYEDLAGRMAVVIGWGRLSEGGRMPEALHEVHLPILTNNECQKLYAEAGVPENILEVFICAGFPSGGFDTCDGDSGGPLMVMGDEGEWNLVGIVSWGKACAAPKQPGVYTRITKFIDWIIEIITF